MEPVPLRIVVVVSAVLLLFALQQRAASQTDAELRSLIQALDVPEKRIAALESLRTYNGSREAALPALTKILETFDLEERAGVPAAQIVSAFDSNNRDAALALRACAQRGAVLVRRTCLEGLRRFPDFWEDTIGAVLNGMGPGGNAEVAYGTLQPLAVKALPVLFRRFSDSQSRDALNFISAIWGRSQKGDSIRQLVEQNQAILIKVLQTSDQNDLLNTASIMLYSVDTPEAKAALVADRARRSAVVDRVTRERNARQTEPQTLEQITASIRPSNDPREELKSDTVDRILDDNLLLTVHRADNRDALMELWQKQGDKYRLLRRLSLDGGIAEFEKWEVLDFSGNSFLHVQIHYPGTGSFRDNHVYHIDPVRHSLDDVQIISAPSQFQLPDDEEIQRGEQIQFASNSITFSFGIWKKNTCGACSFDSVTGTYEMKNESGVWVMRPAELKRMGTR